MRIKSAIRQITLAVAGTVLCVVLCEVLLGWFHPQLNQRPGIWQFDAELGWSNRPGSRGWHKTPEFEVEYLINSAGLRDQHADLREMTGRNLLVFGDSFVAGWGVDIEKTVARQLELRLTDGESQESVKVHNFGVVGFGTDQEILLFDRLGHRFEPQLVMVFFSDNDLWNNTLDRAIGNNKGLKPFFRLEPTGNLRLEGVPVERVSNWDQECPQNRFHKRFDCLLARRSHLYALVKTTLSNETPNRLWQRYYEGLYGVDNGVQFETEWELTGQLLELFHQKVEEAGAEFLLVYVPSHDQIDEHCWQRSRDRNALSGTFDLEQPARRLAGYAAHLGFSFLDLSGAFKDAANDKALYYRDGHWNQEGHTTAADALEKHLLQMGVR